MACIAAEASFGLTPTGSDDFVFLAKGTRFVVAGDVSEGEDWVGRRPAWVSDRGIFSWSTDQIE